MGTTGGAWASIRLIRVSLVGLILSLSVTVFVGMTIILRTCHNIYLSAEAQDFSDGAAKKSGLSFRGEVISAMPVFLAGIADVYLIFTKSFDLVLIVSAIACPVWICLRFFVAATEKKVQNE